MATRGPIPLPPQIRRFALPHILIRTSHSAINTEARPVSTVNVILLALIVITIAVDLFLMFRPSAIQVAGGKLLAFIGLLMLPSVVIVSATSQHMEVSKTTDYCLSCHEMETHGKSLLVDDEEFLPAAHYQNRRIPRDQACYTCHTEYTMYGDIASKLRGLRNVITQYLGTPSDTIRLSQPYQNRECLHCHQGGRNFLEAGPHQSGPGRLDSLSTNKLSCLTSGCHDVLHNKGNLEGLDLLNRDSLQAMETKGQ